MIIMSLTKKEKVADLETTYVEEDHRAHVLVARSSHPAPPPVLHHQPRVGQQLTWQHEHQQQDDDSDDENIDPSLCL